jgi:hypothetical protein
MLFWRRRFEAILPVVIAFRVRGYTATRGLPIVSDEYDSELFPGNFYPGLIIILDRARGRGVVRSHSGREIPFQFPFVSVVGAPIGGRAPGIEFLREGDRVGFDVGWTSKGLCITSIKPAPGSSKGN